MHYLRKKQKSHFRMSPNAKSESYSFPIVSSHWKWKSLLYYGEEEAFIFVPWRKLRKVTKMGF